MICKLAWVVIVISVAMVTSEFAEEITQDGASGHQVVEQVVSLIGRTCIFDNELFLRRMAHVETKDGTAPDTYRTGYNGGIWNIDEAMFLETQNKPALREAYDVIKKELHIDWFNVAWKDLRRPVISGVAASLFILSRNFKVIPGSIEVQATIWSLLRPGNTANSFYFDAIGLNTSCVGNQELDLVLALDFSSTAVAGKDWPYDMARLQNFMEYLLRKFHLDPGHTRVGLVSRTVKPAAGWYLNSQTPGLSILNVLKALRYYPGPATTEDTLTFTRQTMFSQANGARSGAARVALLLTDGITETTSVRSEALKFQQEGINLLVLNINSLGSTQPSEIHQLVQAPKCRNSRQIGNFSTLTKLTDDLATLICKAPIILPEGSYTYPCGSSVVAKIPDTTNSVSVKVSTTGGDVDLFGSKIYSNPDNTSNDVHVTATSGDAPLLFVRGTDPFFLRLQGKKSGSTCTGTFTVDIKAGQATAGGNGTCIVAGTVRDCSHAEMDKAAKDVILYKTNEYPYLCNPKNRSIEYFPHPLDPGKFLLCDEHDEMFVGICPGNHAGCKPTTSGCKYTNPCPATAALNESAFFIDPCGDQETYVKCSFFGIAEVTSCHGGQVWNQDTDRCVFKYVHDPLRMVDAKNVSNPCVHSHADHVYFPYPNEPSRYIFCDPSGNAYALTCRHGKWNQQTKSCTELNPPTIFG